MLNSISVAQKWKWLLEKTNLERYHKYALIFFSPLFDLYKAQYKQKTPIQHIHVGKIIAAFRGFKVIVTSSSQRSHKDALLCPYTSTQASPWQHGEHENQLLLNGKAIQICWISQEGINKVISQHIYPNYYLHIGRQYEHICISRDIWSFLPARIKAPAGVTGKEIHV